MAWMLSLLALLSFLLLCTTKSVALGFVCLMLSLLFMFAAIVALLASRVDKSSRDGGRMLTPDDLRAIRDASAARNAPVASAPQAPAPPADPTAPSGPLSPDAGADR